MAFDPLGLLHTVALPTRPGVEVLRCVCQENSGNDPNTQLVPTSSGTRGSWKQPEEQPPPNARTNTSALTAGSNWAGPGKSPGPYWQPPEGPYPTAASLPPRDRHLNPHEYPTLSAAAAPRPHFPRQPVPSVPPSSGQVSYVQRQLAVLCFPVFFLSSTCRLCSFAMTTRLLGRWLHLNSTCNKARLQLASSAGIAQVASCLKALRLMTHLLRTAGSCQVGRGRAAGSCSTSPEANSA